MPLLLTFGLALLAAVLVSERAERTVLSTAVLFLAVGVAFGSLHGRPDEATVRVVSELALVTILLTDASRSGLQDLRRAWRLPGRALLLGFPITMVLTASAAVLLVHLSWAEGLLLGAVLAPTDPVFASSILGHEAIPRRVRELLGIESWVNDGLALPFVLAFLAVAARHAASAPAIAAELAGGIAIGVAVPWIAVQLARTRAFGASASYERLGALAVGIVVYATCGLFHANAYLAAFAAGVTIGTVSPRARDAFLPLGESLSELFKLAALLVFGAYLSARFLLEAGPSGWAFAAIALLVARPVALALALLGSSLRWRDRLVAGWFGPKGFASVVYGLLVAHADLERPSVLLHLVGATIVLSIVAHSSTDVPVVAWYRRRAKSAARRGERSEPGEARS